MNIPILQSMLTSIWTVAACSQSTAQSFFIAPPRSLAWTESAGYLNLAANAQDERVGVDVFDTCLQGFAWSEGVGWVNFGNSPIDGVRYSNSSESDFGVNVEPDWRLTGYAWSEGGGWISFDTSANGEIPGARIDLDSLRLRGWAWGESLGWVNLDDDTVFVALQPTCLADTNFDSVVSAADFNAWIVAFNRNAAICDQNADGMCTPADFNAWIINFSAGC